jgi:hypothetical protein
VLRVSAAGLFPRLIPVMSRTAMASGSVA